MRALQWYIARRYLSSRKKGRRLLSLITFIATAGVALGVMALVIVIAVMTGLQQDLMVKILSNTPHIFVFESTEGFRVQGWRALREQVLAEERVVAAQPFVYTAVALTRSGEYVQAATLFGVHTEGTGAALTEIEQSIRVGDYALAPTLSGLPGILVGELLANRMMLMPGDTVVVMGLENIKMGALGPMPAMRQFEVTGTPRTGMYQYDNENVYVALPAAQDLLDLDSTTVSGLLVNVTDPWEARTVAGAIVPALLGHSYYAQSWMEQNAELFSALKLEKLAMAVILSLIIVVAAFNIISTLIMVVTDKTREIGILKSMGMTDAGVLRIFMFQGLTIGAVGTTLGAVLGWLTVVVIDHYQLIKIPAEVYFIDSLPLALEIRDVLLIVGGSMLISFGATLYPARQAARLVPVDAIRHD